MKNLIYKIASYFWDIPITKVKSPQNDYLEVVWSMGRKMLNTREANFSFGSGYQVFQLAMENAKPYIHKAESVLILGFGCGSILDLLENKYNYRGTVDGVEYDKEIIRLFETYFASSYSLKPNLIAADAANFISGTNSQYDVVFVDLFIELNNSPLIFNSQFLDDISKILRPNGCLIFNTIQKDGDDKNQITDLMMKLGSKFKAVESISFQDLNKIILAK